MTAIPAVLAAAVVEYGDPGNWVTVPPLTAKAATVSVPASLRYSVVSSLPRAISVPIPPARPPTGELPINVNVPPEAIE